MSIRSLKFALGLLLLTIGVSASAQTIFADGFEPECYGTANDRPGCIVVPFNMPPLTASVDTGANAEWTRVDTYLLIDRSGSMLTEVVALRSNLSAAVSALGCPPLGTGTPGMCFRDAWWGAGSFGYTGSGADAYRNHVDMQPSPSFIAIPAIEPAGCCSEITLLASSSVVTGLGGAAGIGCGVSGYGARATCAGSPASVAGTTPWGYPCFRDDAASFVVVVSDEAPSENLNCPLWSTVLLPQFQQRHTHMLTLIGSGAPAAVTTEFGGYATDTGAVDGPNGNAPLVFDGSGTGSASAFQAAMEKVRTSMPIDVSAVVIDDPTDSIDANLFVLAIELVNDGSAGCPNGALAIDSDFDSNIDTFAAVTPGLPTCFRLIVKPNTSVAPGANNLLIPAILRIRGDASMPILDRRIVFVVPHS